jgi:hypothetical protein
MPGKSPAYAHHRKNFKARAGKPVAGFLILDAETGHLNQSRLHFTVLSSSAHSRDHGTVVGSRGFTHLKKWACPVGQITGICSSSQEWWSLRPAQLVRGLFDSDGDRIRTPDLPTLLQGVASESPSEPSGWGIRATRFAFVADEPLQTFRLMFD